MQLERNKQTINLQSQPLGMTRLSGLTYDVIQRVDFLLGLEVEHIEFVLLGGLDDGHLGPSVVQLVL